MQLPTLLHPAGACRHGPPGGGSGRDDRRIGACSRREKPLVELLGGRRRPITAYASLRSMRPEPAATEAGEAAARGFSGVKLKLGTGPMSDDIAAIRAVREAIGERAELMVDYNQSLSVTHALSRVPALDDERLTWIEEPTRADDYLGHATIAAAARTPDPARRELVGTGGHGEEHRGRRLRPRNARRDEAGRRPRLADRGGAGRTGRTAGLEPHVP